MIDKKEKKNKKTVEETKSNNIRKETNKKVQGERKMQQYHHTA